MNPEETPMNTNTLSKLAESAQTAARPVAPTPDEQLRARALRIVPGGMVGHMRS